jgi:hypothetical protein
VRGGESAQGVSQLEEILQVSAMDVDDGYVRKREAAHGMDRKTPFSGRKRHMSSPILPITDFTGRPTDIPQAPTGAEDIGAIVSALSAGEFPLTLIASRGGPPPELLEEIAAAGMIEERLRDGGHRLRFTSAVGGRPTTIELIDRDGNTMRSLSTAEALEVAAGKSLL